MMRKLRLLKWIRFLPRDFLVAAYVEVRFEHLDSFEPRAVFLYEVQDDGGHFVVILVCVSRWLQVREVANVILDTLGISNTNSKQEKK